MPGEASQTPAYGPSFSYAGFPVQVPEKLRNRTPIDYLFVSGRVRVLTLRLAVRLGREESSLGPFPAARRDRIRLKKKSGRFRQASVSKCEDCLRNA